MDTTTITVIMWGAILTSGVLGGFLHILSRNYQEQETKLELTQCNLDLERKLKESNRGAYEKSSERLRESRANLREELDTLDDELRKYNGTSIKELFAERAIRESIDDLEAIEEKEEKEKKEAKPTLEDYKTTIFATPNYTREAKRYLRQCAYICGTQWRTHEI
jgi:septal ring factor EnvC (AmiA/AmiB activator)